MSYLRGLYLDSFQTTKKHSYDCCSIYIAIFNWFLKGVYPVGVTDLRPYFTQIIGHNSVNVHRIPTKVGTQIRLNEPFKCAKFQPDPNMHSCFMVDFAKCAKWRSSRRKNEEIKTKFCSLVSRKWLERFSSNLVCRLPLLAGTSLANLVPIG